MVILYRVIIFVYYQLIRLAALFNKKAGKWVEGRKDLFQEIAEEVDSDQRHTWFHFASLGEFEQGRSVLEQYKKEWPEHLIVVTFYSPSGYEIRKNYSLADHVFYLPADTPGNARRFLALINPEKAFFTKYDYWYFFFRELHERKIPLYMVSSIYRKDQVFFKWYGGFFRKMLDFVSHFFVQNQESVHLLQQVGFKNITLAGDTRFDRVVKVAEMVRELPIVSFFATGHRVLVAGSTWSQDVEKLQAFHQVFSEWKIIIAPHEVNESSIRETRELFPEGILYSELSNYMHKQQLQVENHRKNQIDMDLVYQNTSTLSDHIEEHKSPILIMDNVGMLSSLYGYGDIAYIGGGFGNGIHNTLEAAAYGMPVLFGPRYHKFQEAKDLIQAKAAFSINDERELILVMEELMDYEVRLEAGKRAVGYVNQQAGATARIMDFLKHD